MDRRKYLKTLALGTLATPVLLQSCGPEEKKETVDLVKTEGGFVRQPNEVAHYQKLMAETFFDPHEMKTIGVLADIIIPKDDVSGSATEAGVPAFIEFMAKEKPELQLTLRGGLKWLDLQSLKSFTVDFASAEVAQQISLVDKIAFPEQATPDMQYGVAFFNLMRDLTATGFFTSEIGIKDLGYEGNKPNQWDGVPAEVLEQYGVKYDQRTLDISVKYEA